MRLFTCLTFLILSLCTHELWSQQSLLISDVHIVDVEKGQISESLMDVLISEGRIRQIAPSGRIHVGKEVITHNAKKAFLIPGLWDMHAHPDDPEVWRMNPVAKDRDLLMPQFVLNGVMGIRDMAGSLEVINEWRKKGKNGELLVPKIFAAGPLLDGPNPMWDGSIGISSPNHVKPVVDSLVDAGVDFLKVYSLLPRDIYFALAKYANEIDFPFVGHVPLEVTPSEASETGMKSEEHLLEILLECSDKRETLVNRTLDYSSVGENRFDRYIYRKRVELESFNEDKARQIFETFAQNQTWHTPTLSMWQKNAWFEEERKADQDQFAYLPNYLKKYWTPAHNDHLKYRDNQAFIQLKRDEYQMYLRLTNLMHKAGVKLLAGTDVGANPLCWPGIGVHNELEELVRAGLSPSEALKTATIHPAEFLEISVDYGSIAEGKVADLVLLKANPLEDISAVREIVAVVQHGILIDTKMRQLLLNEIKDKT